MRLKKTFTVLAVTALLAAACSQTDDTTPPEPNGDTTEAPDPDEPDDADVTGDTVAVFFVRSGADRFYVEPEFQPVTVAVDDPIANATEALTRLFDATEDGSDTAPADPELFTSIPEGVSLNAVSIDGDTVTVDVAGLHGTSGASAQETTLLLQIAHTATYAAGGTFVQLLFDGEVEEELYGHVDMTSPIEVSDFDLSPVTIETPSYGAGVPAGEVTFTGEALVFEANVVIEIVNDDTGASAYSGFTTATAGGPERGTWTFSHTFDTSGTYTFSASESDPSDGEGRPPYTATRTIRVE